MLQRDDLGVVAKVIAMCAFPEMYTCPDEGAAYCGIRRGEGGLRPCEGQRVVKETVIVPQERHAEPA